MYSLAVILVNQLQDAVLQTLFFVERKVPYSQSQKKSSALQVDIYTYMYMQSILEHFLQYISQNHPLFYQYVRVRLPKTLSYG